VDYKRNRLYFFPSPKKSLGCGTILAVLGGSFVIGMIAILIQFGSIKSFVAESMKEAQTSNNYYDKKIVDDVTTGMVIGYNVATLCGFIGLVIGLILLHKATSFNKTVISISDQEIDQICMEHLLSLKSMAIKKHGIDEEQIKESDPIQFDGYYFKPLGAKPPVIKRGNDGRIRSSNYNAIIMMFSSEQVYCYEYRFSLLKDEKQVSTDEYFYNDIVSVSTKTDIVTYGKSSINTENFSLTTSGGTTIGATIFDIERAEKSINAMKNLLRIKKQQHK